MSFIIGLVVSLVVAPLRLRLATEGDLLGWLVAGPYPNVGANEGRGKGFVTDYLNGESSASPTEGASNGDLRWRLARADTVQGLDLKAHFNSNEPGIAYCFTNLESPRPVHAHLLFGSDDGAKVFLNGVQVFSRDVKRGVKRDEESLPISLVAGRNRLLFKVEQYDGGWGIMARIVGEDGSPILGLNQMLEVVADSKDSNSLEREFAGKPGSFDLQALQEFDQIRTKSLTLLKRLPTRVAAPNALKREIESSEQEIHAAMDNADHASEAIRKGEARLTAGYRSARLPLLTWAQNPGPCINVNPEHEDFIRVLPGGRYFAHANGSPFMPIGCNHNPDWPELEEANPLGNHYDPARTDRWFGILQEHGVNVIRMMVETPPSGNLEETVGTFRPEHVIWLDNIFHAALRHKVKLWITPYDTFWMSLRKETSPYWSENGGPIKRPIDFLTKPEILASQERRMKFLIDRYGNSGVVFAWEIMNEIDLWWGATPEQIKTWTEHMAHYVREYEYRRWGRNHLLTISFADAEPKGLNAETAFRRPDLDFATMHLYLGASRGPGANDAQRAGVDFASGVIYARSQIQDNRPVLDGESGPIDRWVEDESLDDRIFHEMSWRHLMAGGAGPGTRWPYRNPHHITAGMLDTLHAMSQFCHGVPWRSLTGRAVPVTVSTPLESESVGFATQEGVIVWLRPVQNLASQEVSIHWNHTGDSNLKLKCYDVLAMKWIDLVFRSDSQSIHFSPPSSSKELAIWVTK